MTEQAVVLLVYALPMLLVPRYWTVLTQQAPLPEIYILRAVGIAFLILSYLELKIVGDLRRDQGLILTYTTGPAPSCPTIIVQALRGGRTRGDHAAGVGEDWDAMVDALGAQFAAGGLLIR